MKKMRLYKQITKKQAGVIYRAYKEQTVDITDVQIKKVYDLTEYDGYDDQGVMQNRNDRLQLVVEAIFANDYDMANKQIELAFM